MGSPSWSLILHCVTNGLTVYSLHSNKGNHNNYDGVCIFFLNYMCSTDFSSVLV